MTDDELREFWRNNGGVFYDRTVNPLFGVEHGVMSDSLLLPLLRRLQATPQTVTCAFCGQAYPPGTPTSGTEAMAAHVRLCQSHPMRKVEAQVARLRRALEAFLDTDLDDRNELISMRDTMKRIPFRSDDIESCIKALEILLEE